VKRCSLVERTLNCPPVYLRAGLECTATLQELKNLAELTDRHLIDERYTVSEIVELLEGFVPAVTSAVLVNDGAHAMESRLFAAE
jgi:hypothetical protein